MELQSALCKKPVDQAYRVCSLTNRRSDTFHAAGANIANDEDSWETTLQSLRWTGKRPLPIGIGRIR
jgi:hypothetical protein